MRAPKLTPDQLELLFRDLQPGLWVVVDLTTQGPKVFGSSEDEVQALMFAMARGGIVVRVPVKAPAEAALK